MSSSESRSSNELKKTNPNDIVAKRQIIDLDEESDVVYIPRFLSLDDSWKFFDYLNAQIPWTRPTLRVFGRSCVQPRDTCYVASPGLPDLVYSGYQPRAYNWDDFPVLKDILDSVHEALPGSSFNSLLLNRYKNGGDTVGWHSDDEKLYGSAPQIASVSFGCDREFFLKRKPRKNPAERRGDGDEEPARKRMRKSDERYSFMLKHGSLLVMRGYTQRDWLHCVPKRAKADAPRINLTFRHVVSGDRED